MRFSMERKSKVTGYLRAQTPFTKCFRKIGVESKSLERDFFGSFQRKFSCGKGVGLQTSVHPH